MWCSLLGFCEARNEHLDSQMQQIPSLNGYKLFKTLVIWGLLVLYLLYKSFMQLTAPSFSHSSTT